MKNDYYALLQITRNASSEEIKKAYRRLARQYHPDVNPSPQAESRFKQINRAYQVLSDPVKKALYDRQLNSPSTTYRQAHKTQAHYSHTKPKPKILFTEKQYAWAKKFSVFSLLFLLVLVLDAFLPATEISHKNLNKFKYFDHWVIKHKFHISVTDKSLDSVVFFLDSLKIKRTPIFGINKTLKVYPNPSEYSFFYPDKKFISEKAFPVDYNIYKTYFIFPFLQLISTIFSLFVFKNKVGATKAALNAFVFWIFTLVLTLLW